MKHLGSTIQGKTKKTQTKTKPNSDDSQISRPDLRFASRKHNKTTQKGPEPQPKHPHQKYRIALDTEGKPNVSSKSAQRNKLVSLWPKKGWEAIQLWRSATNLRSAMLGCTARQPPQSPLRRALSIFQKVSQLREFLQLPKRAWAYIPQKATGIQGLVLAVSSDPRGSVSCLQQCRRAQANPPAGPSCRHKPERPHGRAVSAGRIHLLWGWSADRDANAVETSGLRRSWDFWATMSWYRLTQQVWRS